MSRKLIIDGNAVYEIDEQCMLRRKLEENAEATKGSSENKKDAEMLDTLIQLKEMMSFMEMMQPQDGQGNDSFNPADLFSGIFPADLQEQFHMYSDLFSSVSQNQEHDETDAQQKKENEL